MERRFEPGARDRAILTVRLVTAGLATGVLGLTWLFSNLAEAYFSGKPPAQAPVPQVPAAAAPVQSAPPVITKVVHHSGYPPGGSAPRPPGQGPRSAPPAPPPPACHSTPSKPC